MLALGWVSLLCPSHPMAFSTVAGGKPIVAGSLECLVVHGHSDGHPYASSAQQGGGCSRSSSLQRPQREDATCMGAEDQVMQSLRTHSQTWGGDFQPDGSPRQVRLDSVAREGSRYKGPEGKKVAGWPSGCWGPSHPCQCQRKVRCGKCATTRLRPELHPL